MRNEVWLGDCLELMKNIPDKSVDFILCDLPYGSTKNRWDVVVPFEPLWAEYKRIIKEDRSIVLTSSQPFTTDLINSNRKDFKYSWVWDKKFAGNFVTAKFQPMKTHEDILVFGGKLYNPQMVKRDKPIKAGGMTKTDNLGNSSFKALKKTYDEKNPITILDYPRRLGKGNIHPTEKPEPLFQYLIRTYSNEGDLVLDNCAGSGTTAIAALNSGRDYLLIEKDPDYYQKILDRIEQHKVK